jgi:aldehyde:ferredoxin oxidoreductase
VKASFGSGEALVALSEMAVKREGFGDKMALGTARLAKMLGLTAERLAVTVKGKEFPAHMPTAKGSMGLIYAVNPFGPDHVSTTHDGDIASSPTRTRGGHLRTCPTPGSWISPKTKMTAYSSAM